MNRRSRSRSDGDVVSFAAMFGGVNMADIKVHHHQQLLRTIRRILKVIEE